MKRSPTLRRSLTILQLYKSYSELGFFGNLQQEVRGKPMRSLLFSGSPAVVIYQLVTIFQSLFESIILVVVYICLFRYP